MFGKNKKPLIVTHNSGFHTDDVFAVATLRIIFGEIEIIRTRDEEIIERADYVVDLGHIYDPDKNRFDHHQTEGAGKRGNGIPYASFGLVWKKFGPDLSESDYVFEKFDQEIVQAIDASDNGFDVSRPIVEGVENFSIGQIIGLFQPTWKETKEDIDKSFSEAVLWAEEIIKRKIKVLKDEDEATRIILNKYEQAPDKRLIILDEKDSFGRYIITKVL
ncbi:MAG: metal-dependent hydrolase, partial [Candidatus Levybacteria bacterium CG10_big_fil_rev_8_21_14_0_10_36_7]